MVDTQEDTRVVYCSRGAWRDNIQKAAHGMVPLCPFCRAPLFEMPSEETYMSYARDYERNHHPGYVAFMEWCKGKHFALVSEAVAAYRATGNEVVL